MRIVNNTSHQVTLRYSSGAAYPIDAGSYITRPDVEYPYLIESNTQLLLFSSGTLGLYNTDGTAWSGQALPGSPVTAVVPATTYLRADVYGRVMREDNGKIALESNNQLSRAVTRFRAKRRWGVSRLLVGGNSYPNGSGASVLSKSYWGLMAAEFANAFVCSNYSVGGKPLTHYRDNTLAYGVNQGANLNVWQSLIDDVSFWLPGLNDVRGVSYNGAGTAGCGSDPANFPQFQAAMIGLFTWFLIPETARVRAHLPDNSGANPNVTYVGTWTHTGFNSNLNISSSTTVGNTASFVSAPGNLMVLRFLANPGNGVAAFSCLVDGVEVGPLPIGGSYDGWVNTSAIIPLPTNQAHTVVLTVMSGGGSVLFDSCDCVDTTTDFSSTLLWSSPPPITDGQVATVGYGWSLSGATQNGAYANGATGALAYNYNNGGLRRFAQAQRDAADLLFNLGFNIVEVDCRTGYKEAMFISTDNLHPGDNGHEFISLPPRRALRQLLS